MSTDESPYEDSDLMDRFDGTSALQLPSTDPVQVKFFPTPDFSVAGATITIFWHSIREFSVPLSGF